MKKVIISTAIAAVAAISCCTITSAALTKQEVDANIKKVERDYYDGKIQYAYKNNAGIIIGWECHGYGRDISEDIWGSECQNGYGVNWSRYNCTSKSSFVNELRVGDIVRFNNGNYDHTIVIVGFIDNYVIYTDCNGYHDNDGANTIAWNQKMSKSDLDAKLRKILNYNPGQYGYICRYNGNPFSAWENSSSSTTSSQSASTRTISYSSQLSKAQIEALMFDPEIYRHLNPDVVKVYGRSANSLKKHWLTYGIKEGRVATVVFDAKYYLEHNKDVANAYGATNYAGAYNHFITYGIHEGRASSQFYCGEYYRDTYSDLDKAFKNDYPRYMRHFYNYTLYGPEFRRASREFDVQAYKNNYTDLQKAYSNTAIRYFRHYLLYGKAEKRNPLPKNQ
ncbi:MAG: hypothetical protein J6A05_06000 [Oscillospiraceae bacterium]|nr:hypothetical protein [Oscillospiraceae bacterium]